MAGQYDYSINIPQPPAQNFLQNLMGIRQLQQMDEQSAIQQQQAGFQAQQAQFAQEMQPLKIQEEKARIGQIEQATATSAEAFRQGKLTFEQAQIDRANALRQQAAAQEKQQELLGKFTSLPANASMSEIVPIANQLLLLPGGDKISKQAMENFDALQQEYQKASKTALVTATNQLQAGDVEAAKKTYNTFEQAVRNSGGTNPQLIRLADGIKAQSMLLDLPNDQGVNSAKLAAVQMLSIIDPKAADTILKANEQPSGTGVGKGKSQVDGISDKQQDIINTLTTEAVDARINVAGATDAVNDLLDFAETNPKEFSSGDAASLNKFFLNRFGDTTKAQSLRAAVQPFVTKEWISKAAGLKGALSEKEGARLDKGAPKVETAGPEELLNWLRIIQKVELVDADKKDLNAAWQQNARSLQAKAPVEFEVAGVKVKPGDSFQQTLTKVQAGYRKKNQEDIQADAARLKRIQEAGKSGTSPAFGRFDVMGARQQQQQQPAPDLTMPPAGAVRRMR